MSRLCVVTGNEYVDMAIITGIQVLCILVAFSLGRLDRRWERKATIEALDAMTDRYFRSERESYQSRLMLAKLLNEREAQQRDRVTLTEVPPPLPDEYTD